MQRYLVTGLVAAAITASATPSTAGERGVFPAVRRVVRHFWFEYRENQLWPEPYIEPDRQAVRMPMEIMIAIGWQRQNTLNDHHFEEGGVFVIDEFLEDAAHVSAVFQPFCESES